MTEKSSRAKRLSRDERRAAILDAVVPLLLQHGRSVTSRQIAEAAGIAEGTVYSVFDDKEAIIDAAVERHMDTSSIVEAISTIPVDLSLDSTIEAIVELVQHRVREMFSLMAAIGFGPPHKHKPRRMGSPDDDPVVPVVVALLEPHRAELRIAPRRAASLIRLTTLSMTHPILSEGETFTARDITDLLLHGITVGHRPERVAEAPAPVPVPAPAPAPASA
ncbi:TetR/AcrR family transcriptional regulator [Leifsonia flava]|uniref:TetR/AcrR family transcriptional regulator n=1 Tax=Orlajensenia leifsoniae TaxID=2561933 RepID=A0A4Y9QUY0_9MICO|nr:TetR/AcrR family transcriptional regulator [Leifsonia flava]TFV96384.1 TetR/AcrR family transcriptional regulator [Leifsonia flava]